MLDKRKEILYKLQELLENSVDQIKIIDEATILYGVQENKLDICSLEMATWFANIEEYFDICLDNDIVDISQLIDKILDTKETKDEF